MSFNNSITTTTEINLTVGQNIPSCCGCWSTQQIVQTVESKTNGNGQSEKIERIAATYEVLKNNLSGKVYNDDPQAVIWFKCIALVIGTPFAVLYRAVEPIYRLAKILYYCLNDKFDSTNNKTYDPDAEAFFAENGIQNRSVKALVWDAVGDLARGLTVNLILGVFMTVAAGFGAATFVFTREVRIVYGEMERLVNNNKRLSVGCYLAHCFQPLADTSKPDWIQRTRVRDALHNQFPVQKVRQ